MTAHRIPKNTDDPYVPLTMAQWLEQPVWMETWDESEGIVSAKQSDWSESIHESRIDWEQGTNFGFFGPVEFNCGAPNPDERDVARAQLAAAAPELVRVLFEIEWSQLAIAGPRWCTSCKQTEERGHATDCALDSVLRKAGVR